MKKNQKRLKDKINKNDYSESIKNQRNMLNIV